MVILIIILCYTKKSEPLVNKAQYIAIAWSGGALLFLTAWPAEVLIESVILNLFKKGNSLHARLL